MTTTELFNGTHYLGSAVCGKFTLAVHQCGSCGVVFGFDDEVDTARRRDHRGWRCPNGHSFVYNGESDLERLEREAAQARRQATATRDLLEQEQRSHSATRGHLTRQKRRAANGVCPCCTRTFKDLARHMETKHPEYGKTA
jgi:hypothetical protein